MDRPQEGRSSEASVLVDPTPHSRASSTTSQDENNNVVHDIAAQDTLIPSDTQLPLNTLPPRLDPHQATSYKSTSLQREPLVKNACYRLLPICQCSQYSLPTPHFSEETSLPKGSTTGAPSERKPRRPSRLPRD